MITIFRRHLDTCKLRSRRDQNRCKCPIHAEGTLGGVPFKRQSLDLTSWAAAQQKVREWEAAGTTEVKPRVALQTARDAYIADMEARRLSHSAKRHVEILLDRLGDYMADKGFLYLDELGVSEVREFRSRWTWGELTHIKNIERLRAFFRYCQQSKYVAENPTAFLKAPKSPKSRSEPFSDAELTKIYSCIGSKRLRAFTMILQYTGLRISDAVQIHPNQIQNGKLRLIATKNKNTIWLPLPPFVLLALSDLNSPSHYFWTGESTIHTVTGIYRRALTRVFKAADVTGNPHKFRHTFATTLLSNGTDIELVARILGNSVKIVEKHYDHWIKARQERLDEQVSQTWKTPLVRVK